jgi:cell division protein FtsI (penicillin-binding protein 3)
VADQPANPWRSTLKRRVAVAAAVFLLWTIGIEARLVYFQVIRREALSAKAQRQQSLTNNTPAKRGELLDRNGRLLAYSVDADTIYAVPDEIEDAPAAAAALCGALGDCSNADRRELAARLAKGGPFAYVKRKAFPEQAGRVAALNLTGVGFIKEDRRFYPHKELGSHLLGYVGMDNTGLGGIESTYDRLIKGEPGKLLVEVDGTKHRRVFSRIERPPTAGSSLELTIDQYLQHIAERELREGVEWSGAHGGSVIVMDPLTGEILALANYPTFNPNVYGQFEPHALRNRAVQDLYEPGSTFKIVTAGAALEEKVVKPEDPIDVSVGRIVFGARVIHDDHRYGVLSFQDAIVKSSNVGAIKVGLRLGAARLDSYVRRFGFGRPVSPDFRGESAGIVWDPAKLNDSALASVSMGYQVGVTAMQMASAVSSVANGGELVEPRAVRAVITDGRRLPVPRKVLGRTVSAATAAQLTAIMEGVVEHGTGQRAQIPGYTIAGKTGTAQKIVNRMYSNTDYNVSFVGFAPSRAPAFAIVVVVDTPRKVSPYGGVVAAPIFQKIAEAALRHQAVPPSINAAPPVLVARREDVRRQPTSSPIELPAIVTLQAAAAEPDSVFPDLIGMSARDAVRALTRLGLIARLHGDGEVVEQRPAAGSRIESASTATLWLERRPRQHVSGGTQP